MNKRILIIGAGGHGKVVADIALKNGYTDLAFIDDNVSGLCMGIPIIDVTDKLEAYDDGNTDFIIAVGNNLIRKKIAEKHSVKWISLIHPSAQIGEEVAIGAGTVVMACAIINPCSVIGEHCIINSGAVIEHDNKLGRFVHVSPNAALGGAVCVGDGTHIGIGAIVRNNINICAESMIGAGAVVVKNILRGGVYVGIPATQKK